MQLAMTIAMLAPAVILAQDDPGFRRIRPDEIVWQISETGPDRTTIYGDPGTEGFYIIRVRFRAGTHSEPHYHPNDRHVTVISGTWYTGTGTDVDWAKSVPLGPGSYMLHPGGAVHWDGARDEDVVVEIKGMGPAPCMPAGR